VQAQETAGQAAQQGQEAAGQQQQEGGGQQAEQQQQQGEQQEEEPNATNAATQKAQEMGVDLSQIEGSGAGGRVTVRDVMGAANQG